MGFFPTNTTNLPHEAAISIQQISTIQNSNPMVTVTFAIKPYLARYMYVRYGQNLELQSHNNPPSRLPIPIHLSHLTPIYHFLHQLSFLIRKASPGKRQENICFVLPSPRQGKKSEVYNYFGQDSIFYYRKRKLRMENVKRNIYLFHVRK